ncbi:colicin [Bacillus wiedmannii]|nr:colicin [Bacillus wiedmannii]PGB99450.1 colicin [Bacillus wiedmannii]PHE05046.1 colicin [Bacillus wiedmannii]
MYNDGDIGIIPQEVRDKLDGKEFKSFDDFREEFWKTLADSSYAGEFSPMDIKKLMKNGKAPYSPRTEHYGNHNKYILHHKLSIDKGGDVYNLMIVSPKIHQNVLDPAYHFGNKGL